MGFYHDASDGGTGFVLVEATMPPAGDKLIELAQAYKAYPIKTRPEDSKFGTALNTLDINWKTTFDNTVPSALNILTTTANTASVTDAESALNNLKSDYLAYPRMNQPTPGKFYLMLLQPQTVFSAVALQITAETPSSTWMRTTTS